jgi:hypothetical protein
MGGGVRDSTVKNTVAALVPVLDEAVRDGLLVLDVGVTYSRWSAQSGLTPPALRLFEDGPPAG